MTRLTDCSRVGVRSDARRRLIGTHMTYCVVSLPDRPPVLSVTLVSRGRRGGGELQELVISCHLPLRGVGAG